MSAREPGRPCSAKGTWLRADPETFTQLSMSDESGSDTVWSEGYYKKNQEDKNLDLLEEHSPKDLVGKKINTVNENFMINLNIIYSNYLYKDNKAES